MFVIISISSISKVPATKLSISAFANFMICWTCGVLIKPQPHKESKCIASWDGTFDAFTSAACLATRCRAPPLEFEVKLVLVARFMAAVCLT